MAIDGYDNDADPNPYGFPVAPPTSPTMAATPIMTTHTPHGIAAVHVRTAQHIVTVYADGYVTRRHVDAPVDANESIARWV